MNVLNKIKFLDVIVDQYRVKSLIVLLISLISLAISACSDDSKVVDVKYNICSEMYDCESAAMGSAARPVHFVLPENHGDMMMTIITEETFGFAGNMSDAVSSYGKPYGDTYTINQEWFDAGLLASDAVNNGLDIAVLYWELKEKDTLRRTAELISGYQEGNYYYNIYNYNGEMIDSGRLPVGKTVIALSDKVCKIDIYSFYETSELKYDKGHTHGRVAYENAQEIEEVSKSDEKEATLPNDIPGRFIYSSGIGGWGNTLYLSKTGEYYGEYSDWNSGDVLMQDFDDLALCRYKGRFMNIEKGENETYLLRRNLQDMIYDEQGQSWIEDGVLNHTVEPYGVELGENFILYTPASAVSEIPEDIITWSYPYNDNAQLIEQERLGDYVLYNPAGNYVFWGVTD